MFQEQVERKNIYDERINRLESLLKGNEKEKIEKLISENIDDYLTNCGQKLVNLPANTLYNNFYNRSKLLKEQKEKKKKNYKYIISTLILLSLLICLLCIGSLSKFKYKIEEKIYLENVLLGTYYEGEGISKVKVYVYQNQTQNKITYWNGNVIYSKPDANKTWIEVQGSNITTETKVESNRDPFLPRRIRNTEYKRDVITNLDGNIWYGEWKKTKDWNSYD